MRLRYTRRAARQIDSALDYIAAESPSGAAAVQRRILEVVELLQAHPQAGHITSRPSVRRLALMPYPYLIDYRVTTEEIIVMRFRHGARRPDDPAAALPTTRAKPRGT